MLTCTVRKKGTFATCTVFELVVTVSEYHWAVVTLYLELSLDRSIINRIIFVSKESNFLVLWYQFANNGV
jgi:hypothetical protein